LSGCGGQQSLMLRESWSLFSAADSHCAFRPLVRSDRSGILTAHASRPARASRPAHTEPRPQGSVWISLDPHDHGSAPSRSRFGHVNSAVRRTAKVT
jgi:hypothetical protein